MELPSAYSHTTHLRNVIDPQLDGVPLKAPSCLPVHLFWLGTQDSFISFLEDHLLLLKESPHDMQTPWGECKLH